MIGAIMSMFGGGGGDSKKAAQSSIPDKYSKLAGMLAAKDSALASGREQAQYGGFLPKKQELSQAQGTAKNLENYVRNKKSNAVAKVASTRIKGPAVVVSTEELKEDRPDTKQLSYKSPDYSNKITSENYFEI